MSMGPCPMSVLPFQVPTRVFIFSNSGEPFCGWVGWVDCSAARVMEAASNTVAQTALIVVFIVCLSFNCLLRLHRYNERGEALRTMEERFFAKRKVVPAVSLSNTLNSNYFTRAL